MACRGLMATPVQTPHVTSATILFMQLDHVSYAVRANELADTVQRLGFELGASFVDGGKHPRFGTRNFVLPLSNGTYIEVVAPLEHPAAESAAFGQAVRQRAEAGGGWMGWVVQVDDITPFEQRLGRESSDGHRVRPDGFDVCWKQIGLWDLMEDPALPYFIQWSDLTLHPSVGSPAKATISRLDIAGDRSKLDEYLGAPSDSLLDEITVNWIDHEEAGIHTVTFATENGLVTIE